MLTVCLSVKGGQGCTTVAASLALARGGRATVVDAAGDVPAVLGLREPTGPGLVDLLSSDPVSVDALHTVAVDAGRVGVVPLGRQMTEALASERWRELAEALVDDDGMWVLDAGTGPAWEAAAVPGTRSVLVVRNCYLALRRAVQSPVRPSAVVLIEEPVTGAPPSRGRGCVAGAAGPRSSGRPGGGPSDRRRPPVRAAAAEPGRPSDCDQRVGPAPDGLGVNPGGPTGRAGRSGALEFDRGRLRVAGHEQRACCAAYGIRRLASGERPAAAKARAPDAVAALRAGAVARLRRGAVWDAVTTGSSPSRARGRGPAG